VRTYDTRKARTRGPQRNTRGRVDAKEPKGEPLSPATREFFAPRLGQDLSNVRVHDDSSAHALAAGLHARAFTVGEDLYFSAGRYAPHTGEGHQLIAHELTHVAQQRQHGAASQALPEVSRPGDRAEQEADSAAPALAAGGRFTPSAAPSAQIARDDDKNKVWPPLAYGSGWAPSMNTGPPGPPPSSCFEDPSAQTAAGAPAGFDKFKALSPSEQQTVLSITYASGALGKALAALGLKSRDPKYQDTVRNILRWIEESETRKTTGKTDDQMAQIQAGTLTATPNIASPSFAGTTTTRWGQLLAPAQAAWTARANAAIAKMVTFASTAAPELKLSASTFEFNPDGIDAVAKFAVATVGTVPGKTVKIGFEFVVQVEQAPQYPLQFVVHELFGHPTFNTPMPGDIYGRTYQGDLFSKAAAKTAPGTVADPTGGASYNYWSSELYSWLLQIPYYKTTATSDAATVLDAPGNKTTIGAANWDPTVHAERWLAHLKTVWEPSLRVGLMRGFYKRLENDPTMSKVSLTALQGMITRVFGADAPQILQ
jgi:Domain of unknown function (DUF4157)